MKGIIEPIEVDPSNDFFFSAAGVDYPQFRRPVRFRTVAAKLNPKARSASPLRQTLHDIWEVEQRFQPLGQLPTRFQMAELKRLYAKAAGLPASQSRYQ